MMVALMTADKADFIKDFPGDLTSVASMPFLVSLVWLVFYGPGPISIDWFLSKWLGLNTKTGEST
jgi:hypothetical protein